MNNNYILAVLLLLIIAISSCRYSSDVPQNIDATNPYLYQNNRTIKSLSQSDIDNLKNGLGTYNEIEFLAELNGYPGPEFLLKYSDELDLTTPQRLALQSFYNNMNKEAKHQGELIIASESFLQNQFQAGIINESSLYDALTESSDAYAALRFSRLKAHMKSLSILTQEQLEHYYELRGYDPCFIFAPGTNIKRWKQNHSCTN